MADIVGYLADKSGNRLRINDNVYSTNETIVGTWIDGKPIYRKVFQFINPEVTQYPTGVNIDKLVNLIAFTRRTNTVDNDTLMNGCMIGENFFIVFYKEGLNSIAFRGTETYLTGTSTVILEYTKK